VLKAKLLESKPNLELKDSENNDMLSQINIAIDKLGLKFKRVDEVDIYNIYQFIKETQKG